MLTSLVSLYQENVKKPDKSKFSNLLNNLKKFNKIFRKDVDYDNIKNHKKKQCFTNSLENMFLGTPHGSLIDSPACLGLKKMVKSFHRNSLHKTNMNYTFLHSLQGNSIELVQFHLRNLNILENILDLTFACLSVSP